MKIAGYARSQIVGQLTIQHQKSRSRKRDSITKTQTIRIEVTTNANYTNISTIFKEKTQIIISLNILKNSVSQRKRQRNPKQLKETRFTKYTMDLRSSKSVSQQKSHWQIISLLIGSSDRTASFILLNQLHIYIIKYLNSGKIVSS